MRPKSIMLFEGAFWAWLVVNLLSVFVAWPTTAADPKMQQVLTQMPWFPYVVIGVVVVLMAWLGFATARRASNVGRWLVVAIAVLSVVLIVPGFAGGNVPVGLADWLIVAAAVLAVVAAVLLFQADARAWFAAPATADPVPSE